MQNRYDDNSKAVIENTAVHPLRDMTLEEFRALGGDDLVYVRPIKGAQLAQLLEDPNFDEDALYQLVVSADCTPLLVADNADEVEDWLAEKYVGVMSWH